MLCSYFSVGDAIHLNPKELIDYFYKICHSHFSQRQKPRAALTVHRAAVLLSVVRLTRRIVIRSLAFLLLTPPWLRRLDDPVLSCQFHCVHHCLFTAADTCPPGLWLKVERRLCSWGFISKLHVEILSCQTYLWQYKCDSSRLMHREGFVEHTGMFWDVSNSNVSISKLNWTLAIDLYLNISDFCFWWDHTDLWCLLFVNITNKKVIIFMLVHSRSKCIFYFIHWHLYTSFLQWAVALHSTWKVLSSC